jgi:hypothetical protein
MKDDMNDFYTRITLMRLFKDPEQDYKSFSAKKTIYMADIISYEEGTVEFDNFTGSTLYIVTQGETFYCQGDFETFDKEMGKFLKGLRETLKNE